MGLEVVVNLADRFLALEQRAEQMEWAEQMEKRAAAIVAEVQAMEAVRRSLLHEFHALATRIGPATALECPAAIPPNEERCAELAYPSYPVRS